jgi:exopolysaccharide biosynthesis polyprenyl glycosylphosphotransferase
MPDTHAHPRAPAAKPDWPGLTPFTQAIREPERRLRAHRPSWITRYRAALIAMDASAIVLAVVAGYLLRFSTHVFPAAPGLNYVLYGGVLAVIWMVALQHVGCYEIRHLASGPTEAKKVLRASAIAASVLAIYCYATKTQVARGFVVAVVPLGIVLLLAGRICARSFVNRRRRNGKWVHRILAVGTTESVLQLLQVTQRATSAGLRIVGACVEDSAVGEEISRQVPVLAGTRDAAAVAHRIDADVVAITSGGLGSRGVRELGWDLEGTGRGMVIAPALTQIAGPRVHVSPVEGLPLMWLDAPQLGRLPLTLKRSMDLAGGLLLLLVSFPVLIVAACGIKLESKGPVIYRQRRLGLNGTAFVMLKLRSMYDGSDQLRDGLLDRNEQDGGGVLFKLRRDPRVTRVGRVIRRYSIDELPQLAHVLSGQMSLVGPRPLAAVDSGYNGAARRRLLVRPGLTGLWQVSGRSGLSWDDSVGLDLYYVENWSIGLDMTILCRTIIAVLTRSGAYLCHPGP